MMSFAVKIIKPPLWFVIENLTRFNSALLLLFCCVCQFFLLQYVFTCLASKVESDRAQSWSHDRRQTKVKKLQIQENVVIWFKSQASPKSAFPQNGDLSCHSDSSRHPRFTHIFTIWLWSSSRSARAQKSVVSSCCRTSRGRRKADLRPFA